MSEQLILAAKVSGLPGHLTTPGLHPLSGTDMIAVLSGAGLWLGPRDDLEHDESFRQLIPYVVLTRPDGIVCYRRSANGTEDRLHGLWSIGFGGHVDIGDLVVSGGQLDLASTVRGAADREVTEELGDVDVLERRWIGLLVNNDSVVSRVHIGLVGLWAIGDGPLASNDDAIADVRVADPLELGGGAERVESWSSLVLRSLWAGEEALDAGADDTWRAPADDVTHSGIGAR